jgi:hypothetical protein
MLCVALVDKFLKSLIFLLVCYGDYHISLSGIPTLVILDEEDRVITKKGRMELMRDPEGEDFPWLPRPLNELNEYVAHQLNVGSCLILFTGTSINSN